VSDQAPYCPNCGHPIKGRRTEATTGSRAILLLLALSVSLPIGFVANYLTGGNAVLTLAAFLAAPVAALIYASMLRK
jgi:uncharacterized membrane protein